MSMSRIAIVAPMKAWGGIESTIVPLCDEFVDQGLIVDLLLPRGGEAPYPEKLNRQVNVVDLNSGSKIATAFKMVAYIRQEEPDAILAAKDHSIKSALLARRFCRHKPRVVAKLTNHQSTILRRRLKRILAFWAYPYADRFVAVSEGVKEDFVETFGVDRSRISVIYNPVITRDFPSRAAARLENDRSEVQVPLIIAAGRLAWQKGFDVLVDAFWQFRKSRDGKLIILGEGAERAVIEAQIEKRGLTGDVELRGYVADPVPWMARASLFVLSSRHEGLGNVLVEALAAGAPVVSTDCPSGPREILEDGKLGQLVPVDDVEALADAMERTINHPPPAEERERSLERFRSGPVARQYLETMGLLESAADAPDKPHEGDTT